MRHFIALTLLVIASVTAAQGGAALVDPASKLYQATPGESISGTVKLTNPSPTPLRLNTYLSDWTLDLGGQFTFSAVGSVERSASSWLRYAAEGIELGANESRSIPYTIDIPADAEPGTHWTVLFFESEPSDPVPGQPSATISVRVGHIVYVNVPELNSDGAIVGVFGDPPTAPGRPYSVIAQYANTGNAAQGVEGTFVLRNDRGETLIDTNVDRGVVLPGTDRAFQINIVGPLPAGNYTALMVLDYGDAEREVAGSHDFVLTEPLVEPSSNESEDAAQQESVEGSAPGTEAE